MTETSKLLTDDSILSFTDGEIIKGAKDVDLFIRGACEGYNNAFIKRLNKTIVQGIILGVVVTVSTQLIIKVIKSKKIKSKKLEDQSEA